jgi:hypothetical protein
MVWGRLRGFLTGRNGAGGELAPRRERREAARERHRETGDPMWTDADRHLNGGGDRWVEDVAPGTPGSRGGRTIGDD